MRRGGWKQGRGRNATSPHSGRKFAFKFLAKVLQHPQLELLLHAHGDWLQISFVSTLKFYFSDPSSEMQLFLKIILSISVMHYYEWVRECVAVPMHGWVQL